MSNEVSVFEAREILGRFNASHFSNRETDVSMGEQARYSIPANPARDDDIRLGKFIDQVVTLLEENKKTLRENKNLFERLKVMKRMMTNEADATNGEILDKKKRLEALRNAINAI